jgi:hypothetical protein
MQASIPRGWAIFTPTRITEGAKCAPAKGVAFIAAAATKVPRCQMLILLADIPSFREIAPGVVGTTEAQRLGHVASHLSLQH